MERDCESELSKLNIEQNACIYHFGASVIHGQRSNILRLHTNQYFAPEVFGSNMGIGVDWEKADIYSLAKTILYIFTGTIVDDSNCLDEIEEMDDELKIVLMEMLDTNPANRPALSDLLNALH